ncbi:hypothetical protein D8Y24_11570 [Agrococcus lahaulensis]|nr:hypothetical protein D8Y24_11570 [Agrococcus lahaulensis]
MNDAPAARTTSRFGRARFGGGTPALLAATLLGGAAIASALGALYAALGDQGDPWLRFVVMAVVTLPVAAALVWAASVDRSSLTDATERPEDSVESAWFDRAARGAFGDTFMTVGLAAAAFSITGLQVDTGLLLLALATLIGVDVAVRYLLAKRADA